MATKKATDKEKLRAALVGYLAKGGKLRDLAEQIGVPHMKLWNFQNGRRLILDIEDAQKLADGLNLELILATKLPAILRCAACGFLQSRPTEGEAAVCVKCKTGALVAVDDELPF